MSILKSTNSGTYGKQILPKMLYDSEDYSFIATHKNGEFCFVSCHKCDFISNEIYIFPSTTNWHTIDDILMDSKARIEYTFNFSRLFYDTIKIPIPEQLKKEPEMRTVEINNFHDFTILNMYFNTINPKEKFELLRQLL